MTALPDKRLLWIAAEPCDVQAWPFISDSYGMDLHPPEQALESLSRASYAAIVLVLPLPGRQTGEFVEKLRAAAPAVPVLICDPGSARDGVLLARLGAAGGQQAREELLARQVVRLADSVAREEWEGLLIGESHEMRQVRQIIKVVGGRRSTVLITGETGTGKELAARSLHLASPRRRGAWVAVNCSALPDNLLEAELFGHVKGAFTGAIAPRAGRFEEAQGGTLFLDEIGDLALDLQAKLLRVVQEREVQRLGSSETVRLDVRIVAATNGDLLDRVAGGRFREDLYYRLNVVPVHLPPLRQRRVDIAVLAQHFVRKICRQELLPRKRLEPDALALLADYPWPGNVRQLENSVEMAVALSGERESLVEADFPLPAPVRQAAQPGMAPVVSVPDHGMDYQRTLDVIERSILEQALRKTGGNKRAAAEMLRLKRTTLSAKVRSLASPSTQP